MKKIKYIAIAIFAIIAMAFSIKNIEQNDLTATEIIKKSETNFRGTSNKTSMKMTIVRPKWKRTTTMKSWVLGDKIQYDFGNKPSK